MGSEIIIVRRVANLSSKDGTYHVAWYDAISLRRHKN